MELAGSIVRGTLCFLLRERKGVEICLAEKKAKIGKGKLNGYGGGCEGNETAREAACRELFEESTVIVHPDKLAQAAIITFHNQTTDGQTTKCIIDVFVSSFFKGWPQETDEMGPPQWFDVSKLPFNRMMIGDSEWLPKIFPREYKILMADIFYGPDQREIIAPSQFKFISTQKS